MGNKAHKISGVIDMKTLFSPLQLGALNLKNRICIPPMVLYGHAQEDGQVTEYHVEQYRAYARGGAGLIIQEATCVSPEGRLSMDQLGIWSDQQIPGLKRITEAVHGEGCPIVVQLHHGGIMSCREPRLCPSGYVFRKENSAGMEEIRGTELTLVEIDRLRCAFIDAARRAKEAGYDGVELHGCHSYLLSQFLSRNVNTRTDDYGDGMKLVLEILEGIRAANGPDFLVGIRLGGFEPDLQAGIDHGVALAAHGIDFIDVSYGFAGEMNTAAPGDESLRPIIRAAAAIGAQVDVPVFAVDGITTPELAEKILTETPVDMVDIGRSVLVDPQWANHARQGKQPGACLRCKVCQWRIEPSRCPGRKKLQMEEQR